MISIITPCYNGARFLRTYFNCILSQTFKDIELIFVDDCSTDVSFSIAKCYEPRLEAAGMKVKILSTERNLGAAGAVNLGLKHFTRPYLMFYDCDDILYPNHIEEKINFMEKTNVEFSHCRIRMFTENRRYLGLIGYCEPKDNVNVFERIIKRDGVVFTCHAYIYNSNAFLQANPEREIFVTRAGQNWQILLPMAYRYNVFYLDKILGEYIVRPDSVSRTENTEEKLTTLNLKEETLRETINRINPIDKEYYLNLF